MKKLLATILAATALAGSSAFAAVVYVDFGSSDYTSTSTPLRSGQNGGTFAGATPYVISYSDSSTLSPSSNWTGTNAAFYGGVTSGFAGGAPTVFTSTVAQISPTKDRVRIGINPASGGNLANVNGLVYWKQSDFLNGGSTQTISLDSNSSLSLNITGVTNFRGRWVIQNGTQFYVGSSTNFTTAASQSLSGTALANEVWSPYDPATSLVWTAGGTTKTTAQLTDITAVGFYYLMGTNTGVANQTFNVTFDSFGFTAVPEPTTWALLAGSLTALVIFRRRRSC